MQSQSQHNMELCLCLVVTHATHPYTGEIAISSPLTRGKTVIGQEIL
jgi:hypothetical protein